MISAAAVSSPRHSFRPCGGRKKETESALGDNYSPFIASPCIMFPSSGQTNRRHPPLVSAKVRQSFAATVLASAPQPCNSKNRLPAASVPHLCSVTSQAQEASPTPRPQPPYPAAVLGEQKAWGFSPNMSCLRQLDILFQ